MSPSSPPLHDAEVVALRASEERFRLAAAATSDALWDYDFVRDDLWWCDDVRRNFGYALPPKGGSFASWRKRMHPLDEERVVSGVRSALGSRRQFWSDEYRLRRADGSFAHVVNRAHFLYDEAGEPVRALGSIIDVTAQKRAEERQRFLADASELLMSSLDHEERLTLIARMAAGMLSDYCIVDLVDEDGEIRRVEAAHADPEKESLAREMLRFPPVLQRTEGARRALTTGEAVWVDEVTDELIEAIAQNTEHRELIHALGISSYISAPLRARGRTLGAITLVFASPDRSPDADDLAMATELASRAALALDNARLLDQAQQASRAKSEFLGVMSHEFRTPLTAMIGYADLLESETAGPLTQKQAHYLDRARTAARQLLSMVEEILTFSRTEAGREYAHPAVLEAGDAARRATDAVALLALERGLDLCLEPPRHEVLLHTDPVKLHQILVNLLTNALKYTERGAVRLEVATEEEGSRVVFRVSDTGVGIPPGMHERVFEPFWQADASLTRRTSGVGLGLAIVARLVRLLGGEIGLDSEVGRGSCFVVRLPVRIPDA